MQNYNNSYSHLQDCFCFVPLNTGADSSPQSCMSLNLSETGGRRWSCRREVAPKCTTLVVNSEFIYKVHNESLFTSSRHWGGVALPP